jgi:hypothetical protein
MFMLDTDESSQSFPYLADGIAPCASFLFRRLSGILRTCINLNIEARF